jgi:hypothetical protein
VRYSEMGHSRRLWVNRDWAEQAAGPAHVRNAPLATVGPKKPACRDGSQTEVPFSNYDVRSTPDSDQTADIEQGRGTPVSRARADANRLRDDLQSKIDYYARRFVKSLLPEAS